MSANGEARSCLFSDDLPSPFKAGEPSPLRSIPGGSDASIIKPDLLHNFNLGMGGDLWVSTLWGLCRMKVFEGRSIQARLDSAFESFETWCSWNRKTPHIKCFDAIKFKMTSILFFIIILKSFLGWECSFGPSAQFTTQPCKVLHGIGSKDKEHSSEGRASSWHGFAVQVAAKRVGHVGPWWCWFLVSIWICPNFHTEIKPRKWFSTMYSNSEICETNSGSGSPTTLGSDAVDFSLHQWFLSQDPWWGHLDDNYHCWKGHLMRLRLLRYWDYN